MERWAVWCTCAIHPGDLEKPQPLWVSVFAGDDADDAKQAACEKMQDKYMRHQNRFTVWIAHQAKLD
jgi:hypothetical protein